MDVNQLAETWEEIRTSLGQMEKLTRSDEMKARLTSVSATVEEVLGACFDVLASREQAVDEEKKARQRFVLLHGQLAGFSENFAGFAARKPETVCNAFKARQVNGVLRPLKAILEADTDFLLSLVSEEGQNTYSDVSLLFCTYLAVSAAYAKKHYGLNYNLQGHEVPIGRYGYGRRA